MVASLVPMTYMACKKGSLVKLRCEFTCWRVHLCINALNHTESLSYARLQSFITSVSFCLHFFWLFHVHSLSCNCDLLVQICTYKEQVSLVGHFELAQSFILSVYNTHAINRTGGLETPVKKASFSRLLITDHQASADIHGISSPFALCGKFIIFVKSQRVKACKTQYQYA